jgi:hypothetical protein
MKENVSASNLTSSVTVLWHWTLGRNAEISRGNIMATDALVRNLTSKVAYVGQYVFMEFFFPRPHFLMTRDQDKCRKVSVTQLRVHDPWLHIKTTNIQVGIREGLTAAVWEHKKKKFKCWLTYDQQTNFYEEKEIVLKPRTVEHDSEHTGYVEQSDWMASSYSMSWHTFKWMTKLFFPLLDRYNTYTVGFCYPVCRSQFSYWGFGILLV